MSCLALKASLAWPLATAIICGFQFEVCAALIVPTAVPYSSGPAFPIGGNNANAPDPQYAASRAIDGNLNTFSVLLDDTLGGGSSATIPANGNAPATGHMIFDLGAYYRISGATLWSRLVGGGSYNPRNVDFFYFADGNPANNAIVDNIGVDPDIMFVANYEFPALTNGTANSLLLPTFEARYVGMRVNSSYEQNGATHFNYQIAEFAFDAVLAPEPASLLTFLLVGVIVGGYSYHRRLLMVRHR